MSTKPKKTSRAGRDLPAAIGVGVTLGAGIIAILVFEPRIWYGVVSVALAIATGRSPSDCATAGSESRSGRC